METQSNKSTQKRLDHQSTDKRSLLIGGLIVFLIAISPLLFYTYKSFPETKIWETSLFTWETTYYSWFDYAWFLVGKITPIYLLLLWFFTCKHWWHWIILVPIFMYSFQLWSIINQNRQVDELEIYYLFPLMLIIVPSVYLIRAKLFSKIRGNDLSSFEEELGVNRSIWAQIKDLFQ